MAEPAPGHEQCTGKTQLSFSLTPRNSSGFPPSPLCKNQKFKNQLSAQMIWDRYSVPWSRHRNRDVTNHETHLGGSGSDSPAPGPLRAPGSGHRPPGFRAGPHPMGGGAARTPGGRSHWRGCAPAGAGRMPQSLGHSGIEPSPLACACAMDRAFHTDLQVTISARTATCFAQIKAELHRIAP